MTSKQLQRYRLEKGFTQGQVALNMCVARSTYIAWENGYNMPKSAEKLFCLLYEIPFKNPNKKHDKAYSESPNLF